MMHFAVNDTSVLSTRIYFILNNQENTSRFKRVHGYLCHTAIFAVVIFSVFCVPEPNFRELYPVTDGAVELREDNAYIIDHGTKQYTIYYEGRFFADIDHLSEDLKDCHATRKGNQFMKTTKTLFITLICSFIFSLTTPSSIAFANHTLITSNVYAASTDATPPEISPASHTIVWKYKTLNGVLYKCRYNQTTRKWIGKWIKA